MSPAPVSRLVCIPGTLCAPAIFDPFVDSLRLTDRGAEAEAMSWMTGAGPWDLATVARRIADEIRRKSPEPVVVVGHSTGGAIALELALTEPTMVSGLVLINTGPHMRDHGDIEGILDSLRRNWGALVREAILERSFATPPPVEFMAVLRAYAERCELRAVLDVLSSQRETDYSDCLARISCPVAVVHGVLDSVRTVEQARSFARRFPDSSLALFQCGHTPPYEAPDELSGVVSSVLAAVRASPHA